MYGMTFEKSLKMFGNTDIVDKLELQEKRIAELTNALNELYDAAYLVKLMYNSGDISFTILADKLEQADIILEGN